MIVTDNTYPRVYSDRYGPKYLLPSPDAPPLYIFIGGDIEALEPDGRPLSALVEYLDKTHPPYKLLSEMPPNFQAHCRPFLRGT